MKLPLDVESDFLTCKLRHVLQKLRRTYIEFVSLLIEQDSGALLPRPILGALQGCSLHAAGHGPKPATVL